ncbi:MAG: dihydrolipoamide acetyltransferase family protein [Runella sp.]
MALFEMVMPRMGESVMECTVISILKKVGDKIEADDSVLEVATDKVDTEVPCPQAGVIKEILVKEGDVVAIGSTVIRLETDQEQAIAQPTLSSEPESHAILEEASESPFVALPTTVAAAMKPSVQSGRFYSPLVLNIAQTEGISNEELAKIEGTGAEGRVTKKDILAYLENRGNKTTHQSIPKNVEMLKNSTSTITPSSTGSVEVIPMDRMRRMIAERMVESKRISPHVSSFVETDMTNIVLWRHQIKDEFKRQTGEGITFTPILIEAVVKAIKDFPSINVSVEGDNILKKRDINIGMAVALPNGNLIVPVIHNADQYSLIGLAKKVNDLANRARQNKLTADDLAGGTYTISNIGTFGNIMGTPIILQPQVAIMAFGAIQKRPVVVETPQGDMIGIRSMMYISHSYDHRVVDGALGGMFVKRVSDYLEDFDLNRKLF